MDTDTQRESARIYRFPARPTATSKAKPASPVVTSPIGRGWYHEVAILDAKAAKDPVTRG